MTVTSPIFDESFYDVPAQSPAIAAAVDRVGITGQRIAVTAADPLFGGDTDVLCEVTAEVSLRPDQRGIHMSRIEQAFLPEPESAARSLPARALAIAEQIRDLQAQDTARVTLTATLPLRTRTRVTGQTSPDTVLVSASAAVGSPPDRPRIGLAITATNITACPCMQGYALTELVDRLGLSPGQGLELLAQVPIATHSQKGQVRLEVLAPGLTRLPDYRTLYEVLSDSTTLTQELLKRPDEYDMVRRAHLSPQFVEDVARVVADGAIRRLTAAAHDLDGVEVDVFAESYESIHGHDINAHIRTSPADS